MDIQKEREAFEAYMAEKYKNLMDRRQCLNNGGGYMAWDMNVAWKVWQAAKAQAIPDGFVLVPTTPSCEMWSGIARDLGRYMQMHNRYCPKSLKKYFDLFVGEIPEWLNKEVKDWDSDHAFATADLPAFIYMSMVEAARGGK